MKTTKLLKIIVAALSLSISAGAEEEGYFLNMKQKTQLITLGQIEDSKGIWYDVWICPGYKSPVLESGRSFSKAGTNLKEYVQAKKYSDLAQESKDCLDWAFNECLKTYTLENTAKAWPKYFSKANERAERKLFGWWFSYPYALMQASLESGWRLSTGLVGTVSGIAGGTVFVPAYHMLDSGTKALWNGGVRGILLPASEIVWNTAVSPVLALFGEKPSPERVDGFWIDIIESPYAVKPSQADPASEFVRVVNQVKCS